MLSNSSDERLLWIKYHLVMLMVVDGQIVNIPLKIEQARFSGRLGVCC